MDYSPSLRNGMIIDTGPLLLITFYRFNKGRYLSNMSSDIPKQDLKPLCITLQRLFSTTHKTAITSYVMAEFHALARSRGGLDQQGVVNLVSENLELFNKLEEITISKKDILTTKLDKALLFCFTDTSLMLASLQTNMTILTIDGPLRPYCKANDIPSLDPYYECHLS